MKKLFMILVILFGLLNYEYSFSTTEYDKSENYITKQDKLRFLDSLNKYRELAGVKPLKYSFRQDTLASMRTETIFNHIDSISEDNYQSEILGHMHFNLRQDIKRFDKSHIPADSFIQMYGECSARLSKLNLCKDLVSELFNGWKNSKEHWEIMLDPNYEYISLNWFIDNQRHIRLRKGTIASLVLIKYSMTNK
jgi:uncharacterized protein YkwD